MAKNRKKIDKPHFHRYKDKMEQQSNQLKAEFELVVQQNGWASAEARLFAFMTDYLHYYKKEKLEFEGD